MSAHGLLARGLNVQVQDIWFAVCEFLLRVRASSCLKAASAPGAEAKKKKCDISKVTHKSFPHRNLSAEHGLPQEEATAAGF